MFNFATVYEERKSWVAQEFLEELRDRCNAICKGTDYSFRLFSRKGYGQLYSYELVIFDTKIFDLEYFPDSEDDVFNGLDPKTLANESGRRAVMLDEYLHTRNAIILVPLAA